MFISRAVIFAHYDVGGVVDDYVYYYLSQLRSVSKCLIFVTTAALKKEVIDQLDNLCSKVIVRENTGHDFMSYKRGLECIDFSQYDELIICNDSVYGPFRPLAGVLEDMSSKECAFWGITQSDELASHLQSYFLVFKKEVFISECFSSFWRDVEALQNKAEIVKNYELGLTSAIVKGGFIPGVYVQCDFGRLDILKEFILQGAFFSKSTTYMQVLYMLKAMLRSLLGKRNITHIFWKPLIINNRMPFIKIDLLRDNYLHLSNVAQYKEVVQQTGYDYPIEIIEKHLARMNNKT